MILCVHWGPPPEPQWNKGAQNSNGHHLEPVAVQGVTREEGLVVRNPAEGIIETAILLIQSSVSTLGIGPYAVNQAASIGDYISATLNASVLRALPTQPSLPARRRVCSVAAP